MKKALLPVIIFLGVFFSASAQNLPHKMTEGEQQLWMNYTPPANPLFTYPPAGPVRTMAEWEELQGIIITWTSYPSILSQIVDYAQDEGIVFIVCTDSNSVKSYLTSNGVPLVNLRFLLTGFNSIWCRDYGPWSIYKEDVDSLKIVDWIYNRPRPLDDIVPEFFADYINVPVYQTTASPYDLIATGGNFMTDGHGTGFSSNLILNENPSKTEAQIDTIMKLYMGLERYIKMTTLPYDGIHHIDMHMKLLDEETLLVGQYPPGVADGPQIEANLQYILNNFQTCYGREFNVVRIPMPPDAGGLYPDQGGIYRTYTNSVIVNKTVIIPTYEYQYDTTAFRIYREAMPGYNIVGINSNAIIPSLGAIHCITKEVGVFNPVWISHPKIDGVITYSGPYEIDAEIKSTAGISDAEVYWTTDTSAGYTSIPMQEISPDSFSAFIPSQVNGTEVFYYIKAASNDGRMTSKPLTAPAGFYHFEVDAPVPVELISLNTTISRNNVSIEWSTASEINCRGYEIQRSSGTGGFIILGFVKGKGNSSETSDYSFTDKNLSPGNYSYRLAQSDFDGTEKILGTKTDVIIGPAEFTLEQNFPNPFNPSTTIVYSVPSLSLVSLEIYDALGRLVKTLMNEAKEPGRYSVAWDGRNNVNEKAVSGIYFCRMKAGNYTGLKKMILLK